MTAAQQSYFTSLPNAADVLMIGASAAGDFSPYTLRLVNSASAGQRRSVRGDRSAGRLRSAAGRSRVLLQGRVPAVLRLQAAPPDCPPDLPAAAAHQLPGQGLRLVPQRPARPAEPASAHLGRDQRSRYGHRAGRVDRLRRRLDSATSRTRSPPRLTCRPRAAASRCAGMRCWSITTFTMAATPAPGCT